MTRAPRSHNTRRAIVVVGACALLLASGAASASGGLSGPHDYPATGTGLLAVATSDLNRDGRRDIVVAAVNDDNVSVLYGKKGGGFKAPQDYPTGDEPLGVTLADLNGDHRPDIVVANFANPGALTVLLSKHGGGFQMPDTYKVGAGSYQAAVADFNRDGNKDIAVANYTGNDVSILLGRANGTFKHGKTLHGYSGPDAVVASDLNGDHKTDLAVLNYGSGVGWVQTFLGKGNGTFRAPHKLKAGADDPNGMVAGKFAGDGNLDLAVPDCGSSPNKLYILAGTSKGSFKNPRGFPLDTGSCSYGPAAVDLNHDGRQDIVTNIDSGSHAGDIGVSFAKRGGKFSAPKYYPATGADRNYAVAVGRLNSDKRPDLVVPDYDSPQVAVLYGKG